MSLDYFDWEVGGVTVLNLSARITLDGTKLLRKRANRLEALEKPANAMFEFGSVIDVNARTNEADPEFV